MIMWNIIRAAGIGAYLMLWASVTWGLVATTSLFGKRVLKATSVALHQAFSTLGLLLLVTHLGVLLVDSFMPFGWLDLLVPMRATYRPAGVSFGIGAVVLIAVVLLTSWFRKQVKPGRWRQFHALSMPAFSLALVHGLMTGSDSPRPTMFWFYLATTAILLFLVLLRAMTVGIRAARRTPTPAAVSLRPVADPAEQRSA
jgi:predicted ferric reductase